MPISEPDKIISFQKTADFRSESFFIPDYQRGYRWTAREIEDLLKDLLTFKKYHPRESYSMQPIVVKKRACALCSGPMAGDTGGRNDNLGDNRFGLPGCTSPQGLFLEGHGIVCSLACGIDAADKQHLVAALRLCDSAGHRADLLGLADTLAVDAEYYETLAYAGTGQ